LLVHFSVLFSVFGALVLFLALLLGGFRTARLCPAWALMLAHLALFAVLPVLVLPTAAAAGLAVLRLRAAPSPGAWALACALCFVALALHSAAAGLLHGSAYLLDAPAACRHRKIPAQVAAFQALALLFSFLFELFDRWGLIVVECVTVGGLVFLALRLRFLYFFSALTNAVFFGLFASSAAAQLLLALAFFVPTMPPLVPLLAPVGVFAAVVFAAFRLVERRLRLLTEAMAANGADEAFLADALHLDRSLDAALAALWGGFQTASPLFYNSALFTFLKKRYDCTELDMDCLKLCSFFPRWKNSVERFFSSALERRDRDLSQDFLLFQVSHVKVMRQSSTCREAAAVELKQPLKGHWKTVSFYSK
jgi:hypothetical protein